MWSEHQVSLGKPVLCRGFTCVRANAHVTSQQDVMTETPGLQEHLRW